MTMTNYNGLTVFLVVDDLGSAGPLQIRRTVNNDIRMLGGGVSVGEYYPRGEVIGNPLLRKGSSILEGNPLLRKGSVLDEMRQSKPDPIDLDEDEDDDIYMSGSIKPTQLKITTTNSLFQVSVLLVST